MVANQIAISIDLLGCCFRIIQLIRVTNIGLVVTSTVDFVIDVDSIELIHNQKCSERHSADKLIMGIVERGIRMVPI